MAKRLQNSLGGSFYNKGTKLEVNSDKHFIDNNREYYILDVVPMGAPRMTKSDTWKVNPNHIDPKKRQRVCVTKYFEFKNKIKAQAKKINFELGKYFEAVYLIPMPNSWSEKKKEKMNRMPNESKPDTDNITKAIKDTLREKDADIWYECAQKRWAYKGSIIIYV